MSCLSTTQSYTNVDDIGLLRAYEAHPRAHWPSERHFIDPPSYDATRDQEELRRMKRLAGNLAAEEAGQA